MKYLTCKGTLYLTWITLYFLSHTGKYIQFLITMYIIEISYDIIIAKIGNGETMENKDIIDGNNEY